MSAYSVKGSMKLREEYRLNTRKRLLDAASALFTEIGVAATTTKHVARVADVSHGTVFLHFPRREDLIDAVVDRFGTRLAVRTHALAQRGESVAEILQAHLRGLEEEEALYIRLISEAPSLPEESRAILVGIQSAISHHLGRVAKREENTGRLRQIRPHLLFNTWIGLVHHYLLNKSIFAPNESVIARHGDDLIEHYVRLISIDQGETP